MENQKKQQRDQQLEDKWKAIKTTYREKYPTLTEQDTTYREGEFDDMTQRVAKRTNRNRDQVIREIRDWDKDIERKRERGEEE